MERDPATTISDSKRLIGRDFLEKCAQDDTPLWLFEVKSSTNEKPMIVFGKNLSKKELYAEEIIAKILTKMK